MKSKLFLAIAVLFFIMASGIKSYAQTLQEATDAYNAARELSKTDMKAAVAKMSDVLVLCSKIGPTADETKENILKVLPNWQYAVASNMLKEQEALDPKVRNYTGCISEFEKSLNLASMHNDVGIADKAKGMIETLNGKMGLMMLQKDSADKALTYFDKVLAANPENVKIMFSKAQALKKKGDLPAMQTLLEKVIESGTKQGDTITAKNAKTVLGGSLLVQGQASFKKNALPDAIAKLTEATKYTQNKEAYYMLAVAYNKTSKFDDAIAAANSGMPLDEQTDVKLARYYFEIARAFQGKKDNASACENYRKASFGPSAEAAKYQITQVLKCK